MAVETLMVEGRRIDRRSWEDSCTLGREMMTEHLAAFPVLPDRVEDGEDGWCALRQLPPYYWFYWDDEMAGGSLIVQTHAGHKHAYNPELLGRIARDLRARGLYAVVDYHECEVRASRSSLLFHRCPGLICHSWPDYACALQAIGLCVTRLELARYLRHPAREVRVAAIARLGRLGPPADTPTVTPALPTP